MRATDDKNSIKTMKKVAIIGAGLQGTRRAPVIARDPQFIITWVVDLIPERAKRLANKYHAKWGTKWKDAVVDKQVDIVFVLTYPDSHAAISIEAMELGKDVLCEKPLAKTEKEAQQMVRVAQKTKRILKCGFNHRHHPAIVQAYNLFKENIIGKPLFGRSRYGIAGRKGIEKEWRSNPKIVKGGQLMEQGIHLVDLYRWFLGDIVKVTGMVNTNYWPIAPQEDNGFALLQTNDGVIVSIHSSTTQWINLFEFELYGEKGSITAQGLAGSYGIEKLIISQHDSDGPFSYKTIEYRGQDSSWQNEWNEFIKAVKTRKMPIGNGVDGLKALQIVNAVYKASKTGQTIIIK